MISVVIPIHNMKDGAEFLWRCVNSVLDQTYKDVEIIITKEGKMAENTNAGIRKAKGDIIKILYMDDFLAHNKALENIVEAFEQHPESEWLATGCVHTHGKDRFDEHLPSWNENIKEVNTIGSPSVIAIKSPLVLSFDERMSWLLDCDFYYRLREVYGLPLLLNDIGIVIGVGDHQMTRILTDEGKKSEELLVKQKYENN